MLTPEDKVRGRAFRTAAQGKLTKLCQDAPTDFTPPNFIGNYRHECPMRNNVSKSMEMKETYWRSNTYIFAHEQLLQEGTPQDWPGDNGQFAFIFREGRCAACKLTARSPAGRIVATGDRPPLSGKVSRSGSDTHIV